MMHRRLSSRAALVLAAVAHAACEESEGEDPGMDGGDRDAAAPLDASSDGEALDASDAHALDATQTDASDDRCYSPLNPRASLQNDELGCSCGESGENTFGFCIGQQALICDTSGHWREVLDGPCQPTTSQAPGWCAAMGGITPAVGNACPSGFHRRSASQFDPTLADGGRPEPSCCIPLQVAAESCTEAGYRVLAAGAQSDVLATACSDGSTLRAFIAGTTNVCCQ